MRRRKDELLEEGEIPRKGEPLGEYIARLVAADQERIRIHSDYVDPLGNVIVRPMVMFGKDPNGDYRPALMDTLGRLDVVGVCPEHQADAFLSRSNPVSGTKYRVLPTTDAPAEELVRIISVAFNCSWTVQPTPLELHMAIDGVTLTPTQTNPTNNGWYMLTFVPRIAGISITTAQDDVERQAFLLEARSVTIDAEITGGTVSTLRCRVKWAKW